MHKSELLQLFTKEQRREITYPGYLREESDRIIRQVSLHDEDGYVICSDLTEDLVDEAIAEQMLYYKKLGQRFEWKVYDYDKPADLKERLQAQGFKIGELETMMVLPLNAANPLLNCIIPSNIRLVTDEIEIDEIMLLEEAIWGISHAELGTRLKRELLDKDVNLQIYAVYDHDKMVSAAWLNLHNGTSFSSIWGGSTLPDYRKQGLYSLLLAVRAQAAWREGFPLLTVDASPMSRPILEKKGFEILAYTWPCLSPEN